MTDKLLLCEYCGGPANWTLHRGSVYYHCKARCGAFVAGALDIAGDLRYLDSVASVSAMDGASKGRLARVGKNAAIAASSIQLGMFDG